MWLALALLACSSPPTYIVEGTVVEVGATEVVLDHDEIKGFMGPMTMPFRPDSPTLLEGLSPGDRVIGRIAVDGTEVTLEKIRVTGHGPVPARAEGPEPLAEGARLPRFEVALADGTPAILGEGQQGPVLLTFLYTRCPDPTFCPLTVSRLGALQALAPEVRLIALTLDPDHDTPEVLVPWLAERGATGWTVARASADQTRELAMHAGLPVTRAEGGEIVHQLRWLALDADGRLLARTDGNDASAEALLEPFAAEPR